MTGTIPEAQKQGRTAMPYQSHKRARKREKLSAHKLWPQRRTVNPQKQCAADEKAQRSVIVLAARKDEHPPPQCRRSSVGRAPRQEVCRWFESNRLHQIQCSCEVQAERASGDRAQEGSRNVYLSGLTASSRHAAVTAGKDRHPPSMQMYLSRGRGSDRSVKRELGKSQVRILPSAP